MVVFWVWKSKMLVHYWWLLQIDLHDQINVSSIQMFLSAPQYLKSGSDGKGFTNQLLM